MVIRVGTFQGIDMFSTVVFKGERSTEVDVLFFKKKHLYNTDKPCSLWALISHQHITNFLFN